MNTFSKTLDRADYNELMNVDAVAKTFAKKGIAHRFEHPNRRWEYALTMKALQQEGSKELLDVGGGGSIFAPLAVLNGVQHVLQVDPGEVGEWIAKQSSSIGKSLHFIQQDFLTWEDNRTFDAVVCLSVIEHVPDDIIFFEKLCSKVKLNGLLCLTTDFHPSGEVMVGGHLRTYNTESMEKFIAVADRRGLYPYAGKPDYSKFSVEVNSYTFASLVLRKDEYGYIRDTNAESV